MNFFRPLLLPALLFTSPMPSLAQDYGVTGVISLNGGALGAHDVYGGSYWRDTTESTGHFGIDAKIGLSLSEHFSLQLDGWAVQSRNGTSGADIDGAVKYDWQQTNFGGTVHATAHLGGVYLGGAVGVGGYDYAAQMSGGDVLDEHAFGTVAAEAGIMSETYRLSGQLGYTNSLYQNAFDDKLGTIFGGVAGTYYFTPNISASGTVVAVSAEAGRQFTQLSVEGRYKLESSPLILSLAASAQFDNWPLDGDTYKGTAQWVGVGLKLPFGAGASSLHSLDRAAGLELYQPYYGRTAIR